MPPRRGPRCWDSAHYFGVTHRLRAIRSSPLVALYDVAQDKFGKLHNQPLETRNLLPESSATNTLVPQTVLRQIQYVTNEQSRFSPEWISEAERFVQKAS